MMFQICSILCVVIKTKYFVLSMKNPSCWGIVWFIINYAIVPVVWAREFTIWSILFLSSHGSFYDIESILHVHLEDYQSRKHNESTDLQNGWLDVVIYFFKEVCCRYLWNRTPDLAYMHGLQCLPLIFYIFSVMEI